MQGSVRRVTHRRPRSGAPARRGGGAAEDAERGGVTGIMVGASETGQTTRLGGGVVAVLLRVLLGAVLLAGPARAQVLFQEDFEGSLEEIRAHFGNGTTGPEVRPSTDRPAGSPGVQSLLLRGNQSATPSFYHRLPQDEARLHARYFVKYGGDSDFHHSGLYVGGYAPPSDWPQGDAGLKGVRPNGDKLVVVGFESRGGSASDRLDFYLNWIDMKGPPYQGNYYGRSMLQTEHVTTAAGVWRCVEVRVTLNSAGGSHDGDLAVWLDDQLVQHFRPGSPLGSWDAVGNWVSAATGAPFEGFRWRDSTGLGLNFVRVLNYDSSHDLWVDDLVVSRERIGCDSAGGGGGGGSNPLCGNGVVDAGEACDDGNGVDADGCGTSCEIDHGAQTPFQRRCIDRVNQGIAHVARTRARANERCLARAESSTDFDGCLEEDRAGRLERAAQGLAKVAQKSCHPDDLPELALGTDRLAEAAAAQELPSELARDLFGRPAVAAPTEDRRARRCQSAVLKHAHALSDTFAGEARAALAAKLEGRRTAPAVNGAELSRFVEEALEESPRIAKVAASLRRRAAGACADAPELTALFPGCASAEAEQVAACAERAARCRACELLEAANERLDVDCDLLDDLTADLSCGSAS